MVNANGERAEIPNLLVRWAIVWLPLLIPMSFVALLLSRAELAAGFALAVALILLWLGAAFHAVFHPNQGLHDRWSGTWVVRL